MLSFERMQRADLLSCANLAARAFGDYEYFSIYVEDDRKRQRFLRALLRSEFRSNQNNATFITAKKDGVLTAVAMLCAPDYKKPSDGQYLRSGYLAAMFHGGVRNVSAWNEMEKQASAPCHALGENTWYLSLLTVDPAYAGQGIGSGILRDCLIPYVRQQGGSALCLFTNSQRNRLFYQKNGFTEFHAQQFSYNGMQIGSWSYHMKL
ncbi:MAG: GNAT family N-acetyltransferase [Firmicutes bacterium]|nr:GNAT family N-acetyltransferase [Bacillota bacterium]